MENTDPYSVASGQSANTTDRQVVCWRVVRRNVFLGWTLLMCTPGLLFASPLSSSAWSETTWQEHCREVRTSYNPGQDLNNEAFTLTPVDARWQKFLSWVQRNKISKHHIDGIDTGNGDRVARGVTVHWALGTRWERQTTMSFGYAIAYLVGELGWQDTDFPEFFAQRGGVYSTNLKDRLVLIDTLSASPWQDFFRFLTTLAPEDTTLSRVTAVNPEKGTVMVTAGQGKVVEIPSERYAAVLGQVLTDCRAYEFFLAYDRQDARTLAGQEPGKGLAAQEAAAIPAAAVSARLSPTATVSPIRGDSEPKASLRGRALYEQECSACHGAKGDGKGLFATALLPRPRNFTMGLFRYRSTPTGQLPTDQDLCRSVARGLPGTAMPAWGQFLRQEEIQEVIAYLKRLSERFAREKPTEIITLPPVPPVAAEGLAHGKQLFTDMGCVSCHGEDGKGKGSAGEDLKTAEGDPISPRDLTDKWSFRGGYAPEDIFLRLSTGLDGAPMPSYRGMVSDEELWNLVFYILSLSPSERPQVVIRAPEREIK